MEKFKIKLATPEDASAFINVCSKYISDINIYIGHIVMDAKSIISVFTLVGKRIEVKIITLDEEEEWKFLKEIERFRV